MAPTPRRRAPLKTPVRPPDWLLRLIWCFNPGPWLEWLATELHYCRLETAQRARRLIVIGRHVGTGLAVVGLLVSAVWWTVEKTQNDQSRDPWMVCRTQFALRYELAKGPGVVGDIWQLAVRQTNNPNRLVAIVVPDQLANVEITKVLAGSDPQRLASYGGGEIPPIQQVSVPIQQTGVVAEEVKGTINRLIYVCGQARSNPRRR